MIAPRFAENLNVVEKYKHKLAQVGLENIVHDRLEGSQGISEAKREYRELVMA